MNPLRTIPLLIAAILLTGCLAPSDPSGTANDADATHDSDAVALRLAADLAALPCAEDYTLGVSSSLFHEIFHMETQNVRYGEIDVIDGTDLVVFARYQPAGFDILNVSDPYEPEHVAAFPIAADTYTLDAKASGDGKTLYLGDISKITIVDIQDPYAPNVTRTVPLPMADVDPVAQAHMLHVSEIAGSEYLFVATPYVYGVLIYKATGSPGDVDLELVSIFAPLIGLPLAAHDMMVYHDPVEASPILWVANGFGGFIAADVSDPALPVPVSYTPELDPYQGYTHTISVTHYDEKRYAVTMAELGLMAIKVYDVTDMAVPILLATWSIDAVPLETQHNTQIMGDWMWLGHYGHGVVLFNLKEQLQSLTLPAYNLGVVPVVGGIEPFAQYLPSAGSTWESVVVSGVHWTTSGGIYGTLNGCFQAPDVELRAYV